MSKEKKGITKMKIWGMIGMQTYYSKVFYKPTSYTLLQTSAFFLKMVSTNIMTDIKKTFEKVADIII